MKPNHNLDQLNTALTNAILREYTQGEKTLLTFSGGMDTRVILAVMLKHNIQPDLLTWDGSPYDIKIAKQISKDFNLRHIIIPKKTNDKDWLKNVNSVLNDYDVIYYGELMSEIFNKYVRFTESEKKLNTIITNFFTWVDENVDRQQCNKAMPCLDKEVIRITEEIPICFRVYGYINRHIIKLNFPHLLRYSHTTVNLRYRVCECLYWLFIPLLEHYINGDDKRTKKNMWQTIKKLPS